MQLCFLGVTSAIKNHWNSNMHTLNQGWVIEFRVRVKIAESCLKTLYNLCYVICTIYGLEKVPLAPVCSRYIKKWPLYFTHATQKFYSLKAIKIFYFVWKFASARKYISHCKLFEVIWFYIVLCPHIKLVKGPPFAHFLLYFEKHMAYSRACGSRVFHQLLNKTMQKNKCESLKEGHSDIFEKGGPRRQPCSPSLISTPALSYIQKKELASFYNTIDLIKVLWNVIKIFFDHSVMLRIT